MRFSMGLGPWYRIGLSLSNAIILAAIIETIVTCNAASHWLAFTVAKYHYGFFSREQENLAKDIREHPQWVLLAAVFMVQILADIVLWFAVIIKGNKHFALLWVMTTLVKTFYSALVDVLHEWGETYDVITATKRILSFLWGTVLFGFCIITGIQTYLYLSTDEGKVKLSPVGQGICAVRDFYRETPVQLAVVLLISEIAANVHRSFHYPITPYLMEASYYLSYKSPIDWGTDISICTIVINAFGLILLAFKNSASKKAWVSVYVILMIANFILLVYIVIDWSPVNIHPHMFNGFVFVSLVHLLYKVGILYVYLMSSS